MARDRDTETMRDMTRDLADRSDGAVHQEGTSTTGKPRTDSGMSQADSHSDRSLDEQTAQQANQPSQGTPYGHAHHERDRGQDGSGLRGEDDQAEREGTRDTTS